MRVVLDTNILVSALFFGGELDFVAQLLSSGKIVPCFTSVTWREITRVFDYPHLARALAKQEVKKEDILARLALCSLFVPQIPPPFKIPEDPDDEAILACAISARAVALVTGDKALLSVATKSPVPILTANKFKEFLSHKLPQKT